MSATRIAALKRLLAPKSIAVLGGDSAAKVVHQCQSVGFTGEIWAVNPRRRELAGIPCVARIADLPGVPDAAFIAAPPEATLDIVGELAQVGVPGAVCFAAGFAETGTSGAALEDRLRDAAGDMAVIGPNCHGFINYLDGIALWPDEHGGERAERGVAIVSQSGNVAINLTMQQRGLDLGYVVSVGNNSVLGVSDFIDALLEDRRVTAIGLHIEGLDDVAAFSGSAIKALSLGIPIVALKAGRSERGTAIAMGHTGSLAGSDKLYTALFTRLGIARCNTVTQFLETLKFVSQVGALPGRTLGSMSCSGGDAAIVADTAESLGLETPSFSDASAAKLQALLGPNVNVTNPLDYHLYVWGDYDKLRAAFDEVLGNGFACTLLVLDYPPGENGRDENWQIAERALTAAVAATGQRAVVVSSLPETMPRNARDRLKRVGIAPMQGIEDCLYAIWAAAIIGAAQRGVDNTRPVLRPRQSTREARLLDEWSSKQELARHGVVIPRGQVCSADNAAATAESLGYPVVLKALSRQLAHKSEAGAVALNLSDSASVRNAAARMANRFERFLVEKMIQPAVAELIVGISRDETFGLTLLLGSGGTLVELVDDTVSLLLPAERTDIRAAIGSLKAGKLIAGFRGGPAGDLEAVVDTVEAILEYAEQEYADLLELDVNPLLVLPHGAVAVDALIRKS